MFCVFITFLNLPSGNIHEINSYLSARFCSLVLLAPLISIPHPEPDDLRFSVVIKVEIKSMSKSTSNDGMLLSCHTLCLYFLRVCFRSKVHGLHALVFYTVEHVL